MKAFFCPKCGTRTVPRHIESCEYRQTRNGVVSGCGIRVPYNKTWRFCPVCGKPICRMGWIERRQND